MADRKKWGDPGSKVARKTAARVFSQGAARPVIVALYPDGVIGLRLSKHRREEYVNAADIYRQAALTRMSLARMAKRKAKKGKA